MSARRFPRSAVFLAVIFFLLPTSLFSATPGKRANGLSPDEVVSADELYGMMRKGQKVFVLDARSKRSFDAAHIGNGRFLWAGDVLSDLQGSHFGQMDNG